MRRQHALAFVVLAAVAVALPGCGGGSTDTGGNADADKAEIQNVVSGYSAALAAGEGERACSFLGREMRAAFDSAGRASKVGGCAGFITKITHREPTGNSNVVPSWRSARSKSAAITPRP